MSYNTVLRVCYNHGNQFTDNANQVDHMWSPLVFSVQPWALFKIQYKYPII